MLRANGRRLWRCRIYTLLILVLTGVALLITWKHLPDEQNFGKRFRSTIKQTTSATGSNYFDTRQPVEKVSVQQVTLVHAERSYPKKNGTDSDNSESASSPLSSPSTPTTPISPPATVSASLSPAESTAAPSSTAFPSPDESVVPSAELTELSSAEQKLAKRKALIETSKKALMGLNDCPHCTSSDEDKLSDIGFLEKFGGLEVGRQQCLRDIRDRIVEDFRPLFADVERVILMDVALHTNMGDNVLWRAAVHLASLLGHSVNHVCAASQGANHLYGTMSQFPHCNLSTIMDLVKDRGLVLYHAGGNWGDLYRFVQKYRMKAIQVFGYSSEKLHYNFKVAQLPQTIYYKDEDGVSVDVDDFLMNSLRPNFFTLFTRQTDSYEFAEKHYGSNVSKVSTADLAFVLGDLWPIGEPEVDILVLIRTDGELAPLDKAEKELTKRFLKRSNVTFAYQDWYHHPNYTEFSAANPTILSEVRLNEAIKIISKGQIVITNRMHGSVLATLIGRTLLWVDTTEKKLAGVRQTAFNMSSYCTDENLRSFEFPTMLDAAQAAVEYLSVRPSIESLT